MRSTTLSRGSLGKAPMERRSTIRDLVIAKKRNHQAIASLIESFKVTPLSGLDL
ncbi:MAG: hypothetical protein ICV63_10970 [Coleofasciculus sp. Co-bin14]|nr:hypothetical protein [Coleofasciculus sp. Co-bin14]